MTKQETQERKREAYRALAESDGGKLLIVWLNESMKSSRENAHKLQPTDAWGDLKFAEGLQHVVNHIQLMSKASEH